MKVDKLENYIDYITAGGTPSTSVAEYWENGIIPWMSSGEVNKKIIRNTDKYITQLGYDNSSTKMIDENCVLIALAGQGKTRGMVALNEIPICTNQSIAAIKTSDKLNYRYLYHYLSYKYVNIREYSSGDGGRGGLNLTMLKNYNIQVCSIDEQIKIANFLSSIDDLIEQSSKLEELYAEQRNYYVDQLLYRDYDRFQFDEIFETRGGTALEKYQDEKGKYRFISIGNYAKDGNYVDNNTFIDKNSKTENYILNKNDLVMVLNDKTLAGDIIGSTLYINDNDTYIYNQRSERLITNESHHPKYMWYYLNSQKFRNMVFKNSQGNTQIYVNMPVIKKLVIKAPSYMEQEKISNFLSVVDELINYQKRITNGYKLVKQYHLNNIFK